MHTDNLSALLRILSHLPDLPDLKIEGRIIDADQFEKLGQNPCYRFFMNGRIQRAKISETMETIVCLFSSRVRY